MHIYLCLFRDLPTSTSNVFHCKSEQRTQRRQDDAGRFAPASEQLIEHYAPSCPSGQRADTSNKGRPRRKVILDLGVDTSVLVNVCWGLLVCNIYIYWYMYMYVFRDLPRSKSNALPCSSEQHTQRRQDDAGRNLRASGQRL